MLSMKGLINTAQMDNDLYEVRVLIVRICDGHVVSHMLLAKRNIINEYKRYVTNNRLTGDGACCQQQRELCLKSSTTGSTLYEANTHIPIHAQ